MSEVPVVYHDRPYCQLLEEIYEYGEGKGDRTGTGTVSIFGGRMEFDIRHRFPLLTGKTVHWKSVVEELLWFMRGETNIKTLNATIWDEWADEDGECGPIYGHQWRTWEVIEPDCICDGTYNHKTVDQLQGVVDSIQNNPDSRRHIVSAWNVGEIDNMALPPCHLLFQFNVCDDWLDCQMYQRSCDMFLGVPFNIASYSLLTYIIAYMTNTKPRKFVWVGGDCHIYKNHYNAVETYLGRSPTPSPLLRVNPSEGRDLNSWKFSDFELTGYEPRGIIKAKVAI